jgi:hypothetical protein
MNSPEYEEILSSLQDLTHRSYLLGRSEALKRVIAAMQADETPAKPLQLMAPADVPPPPATESSHHTGSSTPSVAEAAPAPEGPSPWWARPPRPVIAPIRTTH